MKFKLFPAQGVMFSAIDSFVSEAATPPAGLPTHATINLGGEKKSVPYAYLDKDVIEEGPWYDLQNKREFNVDLPRMQMWVDKFNQMRAAGLEIPAPIDHTFSADSNLGFIVAARIVPVETPKGKRNRLRLTYQIPGEEGAQLALRNRASIYVKPQVIDGTGKNWGEAIIHSAFTPYPVVHGMGEFMPFAASRGPAKDAPLILARANGDASMDPKLKAKLQALAVQNGKTVEEVAAMSDDDLNNWGLTFLLSDESAEGDGAGTGNDPNAAMAASKAAGAAATKTSDAAFSLVRNENTQLKTQVIALSRYAPRGAEADLTERMGLINEKLETLVEKGRISPAQRDKISGLMKGKDNKPNHLVLSRFDEADKHLMGQILDVLSMDGTAVAAGEKSGAQDDTGLSLEDAKKGGGGGAGKGNGGGSQKMSETRKAELMGPWSRRPAKK